MKALIKLILLASVIAGIAYMANQSRAMAPTKYNDVVRAQCLQEAGSDRDSQEACVTGKLLRKYMDVKRTGVDVQSHSTEKQQQW